MIDKEKHWLGCSFCSSDPIEVEYGSKEWARREEARFEEMVRDTPDVRDIGKKIIIGLLIAVMAVSILLLQHNYKELTKRVNHQDVIINHLIEKVYASD
jgi:hypothetical protein